MRGDRSNKGAESGCKAKAAGNAANVILRPASWVILEKATSLSTAFAGKISTSWMSKGEDQLCSILLCQACTVHQEPYA